MPTLRSEVAAHVLEAFEYLDDELELVSIERLVADPPDTVEGYIPTAPEVQSVDAYVVEMRARAGEAFQPGDILVAFRTATLTWAMEASSSLQRGDGRRYSVVGFDTTTRALTLVHARHA